MPKKSVCTLCEELVKTIDHHFSYVPSLTCPLCYPCHSKVHGDLNHFLNPWNPESLWEGARYKELLSRNLITERSLEEVIEKIETLRRKKEGIVENIRKEKEEIKAIKKKMRRLKERRRGFELISQRKRSTCV